MLQTSAPTPIAGTAAASAVEVLASLGVTEAGLTGEEAERRLAEVGPNALRTHRANGWLVLGRQFRSPILLLLIVTALLSLFLGDSTDAVVIGVILTASVGLGFVNEFRAERAAEALHSNVTHRAVVLRDNALAEVNVVDLVPGDIIQVTLGAIVPADIRLLHTQDLLCDEGILTGESLPAEKDAAPVEAGVALADMTSCVFMGTVVAGGSGTGVVVATGARAEFGRIALALGERQPETEFQVGLRRFSMLLLQVAIALTTLIFVGNMLLHRPVLESLLFSLAIAVGITPQLLPAVVSSCLAMGTRQLAARRVLVKRLVSIEGLGDMDILVTDKTGTLTEGRISFTDAVSLSPACSVENVFLFGLLASEADYSAGAASGIGQNPLDEALWESPSAAAFDPVRYRRLGVIPFDHRRRMTSSLVAGPEGTLLITKGSPEDLLRRCVDVPESAAGVLNDLFDQGSRVVAVATKALPAGTRRITASDENGLQLAGLLVFLDRPKTDARDSLSLLASLGITVKIATGDNARVAEKVCRDLGLVSGGTVVGTEIDALSDEEFLERARISTIFARVSPEQKGRLIRLLRKGGGAVGFLGDGVNDALALHHADLGISVDSATDVAKDAADIVLLDKDLGVLAEGVIEGRRIFANTIKYVLMGTSSNFGNMFSASIASMFLSFLPMLPGQILLNNLLYDVGQLAIPGDRVDREQLIAPSKWDIGFIRRFMLLFGPISSLFDFATFGIMIFVFNAAPGEFRSGWFIESLATQTLIIFAIRTRRVPFFRSRPSTGLIIAATSVVAIGIFLPLSPVAGVLGFDPLPAPFFLALFVLLVLYLVLVEFMKLWFFSRAAQRLGELPKVHRPPAVRRQHRVNRRAARFSTTRRLRRH